MTNAVNNFTRILVVDDEKELADVLELYLANDGYTVLNTQPWIWRSWT